MAVLAWAKKAALTGAAFLFLVAGLVACAGPDAFGGSRRAVVAWSGERGFAEMALDIPGFSLLALARGGESDTAAVYIEGDGAAWASAYHPPRDPTPVRPLALALAATDPGARVIYLGRPCQYLDRAALELCAPRYWITHRFAPEVLHAYEQALDQIKRRFGLRQLRLVGYSGGGVIAILLANRRDDVAEVVTVAAPLALAHWATAHGVTPLRGSLDPFDEAPRRRFAATHMVGEDDKVTPAGVVAAYVERHGGRLHRVQGFDHYCCWSRDWKQLLGGSR